MSELPLRESAPVLLDLFCCEGGAAKGYADAGFDVLGVDIVKRDRYPFEFRQDNALWALKKFVDEGHVYGRAFDAIHASPPCQSYLNLGAVNRALGRSFAHPDLVHEVRELLVQTRVPWVIENVEGSPLENPVKLCGSSFGLAVRRHRLFETNFAVMAPPCAHHLQTEGKFWTGWRPNGEKRLAKVVQVYGNAGGKHEWPAAMGIDWMSDEGLVEAIPPAYTEHIGGYLMAALKMKAAA